MLAYTLKDGTTTDRAGLVRALMGYMDEQQKLYRQYADTINYVGSARYPILDPQIANRSPAYTPQADGQEPIYLACDEAVEAWKWLKEQRRRQFISTVEVIVNNLAIVHNFHTLDEIRAYRKARNFDESWKQKLPISIDHFANASETLIGYAFLTELNRRDRLRVLEEFFPSDLFQALDKKFRSLLFEVNFGETIH